MAQGAWIRRAAVLLVGTLAACGPRQTWVDTDPADAGGAPGEIVEGEVPAGTEVRVRLDQRIDTRSNQPGDRFTATVDEAVWVAGDRVIPEGAKVQGEVTAVQESGGQGEAAVVKLAFHEMEVDGRGYPIDATVVEATPETEGRGSTLEDAAKIGGGAAAGAAIGAILTGEAEGALIGAAVGGAAGTAIVLGTKDVDAVLPEGSPMTLRIDRRVRLTS